MLTWGKIGVACYFWMALYMTTGDRESALLCHFVMHLLAQILLHNFWDIERRLLGIHGTLTKKQLRHLISLLTIHVCWWMNHLNCSNMWRDSLVCFINHRSTDQNAGNNNKQTLFSKSPPPSQICISSDM